MAVARRAIVRRARCGRRRGYRTMRSSCSTGSSRRLRRTCWSRRRDRLRLVALVHMPLGSGPEQRRAGSRRRCSRPRRPSSRRARGPGGRYSTSTRCRASASTSPSRASTGAELAPGTATAGALLSVAAVTPGKGHDVLVDALATADEPALGVPLRRQPGARPGVVGRLRRRVAAGGMGRRVRFPGPRAGAALAHSYATADVLVLPSRAETYGMVVTEALARGLPVVAADVGGVPEALGHGVDGTRPGSAGSARRRCRAAPTHYDAGSRTPTFACGCAARPANAASRSGTGRRPTDAVAEVLRRAA